MSRYREPTLLIIEDSDEDFVALSRIISQAKTSYSIYRCEDGEEALDFLHREGTGRNSALAPLPSLIVLDLNLPGTDGREVLADLKQDPQLKTIPIVVFTTSANSQDVMACYQQGVSGYIVKPMDTVRLQRIVNVFLAYWFETVELPQTNRSPR